MKPVLRYHGSKYRLATWVMSFFPEHTTYVEPFGGAAGVLMQKAPSESEVYNDLDNDIVNVFKVLRDQDQATELARLLTLTPYSRAEFELAYTDAPESPVERARQTIIRAQMGFGSAGATKGKTGFRQDSARKYGTAAQLWAEYPKSIQQFCQRLQGVLIENRPAIDLISGHDRPDTLFYVDPPYVLDTRVSDGNRFYRHEMSDDDHIQLIETLKTAAGLVVLSGYSSDLYQDLLPDWDCYSTTSRISAGRGTGTRTECVWLNPACAEIQKQQSLFA